MIEKGLENDKEVKYCARCKDERKDQKLVGMFIMKNVKATGDSYEGTEILDPFSGNTYRVKLKLKDAGKKWKWGGLSESVYLVEPKFGNVRNRNEWWKTVIYG